MAQVTRVLLVDPDPPSRRALSETLGQMGLTVSTADSMPLALMRLGESTPDVVVLDYGRADLLAEKIVRTIRLKYARVPLILLVGELQARQRATLNALGVRACVPKLEAPHLLGSVLGSIGQAALPSLPHDAPPPAAPPSPTAPPPPETGDPWSPKLTRTSARIRAELRAEVEVEGRVGGAVHHTHDVSEGGVFLRTHDPPAVGTRIRLRLALPEGETTTPIEGQVAHVVSPGHATSQRPPGVGVRFTRVDEQQRAQLSRVTETAARHPYDPPSPTLPLLPLDDTPPPQPVVPTPTMIGMPSAQRAAADLATAAPTMVDRPPTPSGRSSRAVTLRALLDDLKEQDHFAALGVRRDATAPEIERAFEDAARLWHPARFAFDGDEVRGIVNELFMIVCEARDVLVAPGRNRVYREALPAQAQRTASLDADALFGDLNEAGDGGSGPRELSRPVTTQSGSLDDAATALRDGDLDRAEALYQAQLVAFPNDEQAISGLRKVGELRRGARRGLFGRLLKGEKP